MTPKKIALFGCGTFAQQHYRELKKRSGIEVSFLIDPSEQKCEALITAQGSIGEHQPGMFSSIDEFLAANVTYDAGIIVTPSNTHHRIALPLLLAGKHVYVEKPLTVSTQETSELALAAAEHDSVFMVGASRNMFVSYRAAAHAVGQKKIGDIVAYLFYTQFSWEKNTADNWRQDPNNSGAGILADHSPHFNHYLFDSLGFVPAFAQYIDGKQGRTGVDIAAGYHLINKKKGTTALVLMDGVYSGEQRTEKIKIYGKKGTITIEFRNGVEEAYLEQKGQRIVLDTTPAIEELHSFGIHDPKSRPALIHNFVSQLLGETDKNASPGYRGELPVRVTEAVKRSKEIGEHFSHKGTVTYHPLLEEDIMALDRKTIDPFVARGSRVELQLYDR